MQRDEMLDVINAHTSQGGNEEHEGFSFEVSEEGAEGEGFPQKPR